MQKYRMDHAEKSPDGSIAWYAGAMGGPTLSKIENCRLDKMAGNMRRTVYITGEPDTWFSSPAFCKLAGKRIMGYVTGDDEGNKVFRHRYY